MYIIEAGIINIFYDLWRLEGAKFDSELRFEIQAIERRAASKGMLASGETIHLICEAGANSLRSRCRMSYTELLRVMNAHAIEINRETGTFFLSEIGARSSESAAFVQAIVSGAAVFRSGVPSSALRIVVDRINQTHRDEIARMNSEVSLLIATSENVRPMGGASTIAITGDGNIVVAGDDNDVTAFTQIDTAAASMLADALKLTLRDLRDLSADGRVDHLKALIEKGLSEIEAPEPNKGKIFATIRNVAEVIKFLPELKAAYEAIKSAAALLGLDIP